jgi:hypothetical protein
MSRRAVLLKPERHREKVNLPCKARERKDKPLKKIFERKREDKPSLYSHTYLEKR